MQSVFPRFFGIFLLTVVLGAQCQSQTRPPSDPPRKSPTQLLAENDSAVALIVSADDKSVGLGSGFFVSSEGLLVTNLHVVQGAKQVFVRLKDKQVLEVSTVVGFDPDNDLAILRVQSGVFNAVRMGDSAKVQVGEPVIVISNPEGLERSITNGLVSGVRTLRTRTVFQISAPISPGSSGGPVFNEKGEVIGVVVFYLEGGQNLNFAIPINSVKTLLQNRREISLSNLPRREEEPGNVASNPMVNLDGAWAATFADSLTTGQMALNLTQDDSGGVGGTYTTSLGGGGSVKGTITGDTFEFDLTQSLADCPGRFRGSAKLKQNAAAGSYSGTSCQGTHANGTFSMSRGTGAVFSPTPASATAPVPAKPIVTYGTEAELEGVRTVFVYAEDLEVRGNIIKSLEKDKGISLTNEVTKADVVLVFGANSFSMGDYTYVWTDSYGNVHGSTTPRYGITGFGYAIRIVPPNTIRVLWQFQDTRTTLYERRPSTNFARNFIRLLKTLNK